MLRVLGLLNEIAGVSLQALLRSADPHPFYSIAFWPWTAIHSRLASIHRPLQ